MWVKYAYEMDPEHSTFPEKILLKSLSEIEEIAEEILADKEQVEISIRISNPFVFILHFVIKFWVTPNCVFVD